MKNLFSLIFASLLFFSSNARADIDAKKAQSFVEKITTEGIEEIINANISQDKKDQRFEKLFNEALDLDFIGQFVLGRYWKTASETQRTDFIKAYRDLNTKTWGGRFDEFKGRSFVFTGTTSSKSPGQVFVNSHVDIGQQEPAKVLWRVKETNGKYKIIDIIIENVSLAISARNEYAAFIKNNPGGIDALIKDLQNKIKQPQPQAVK